MHTTIKRIVDQLRKGVKLPFDEVARIFETEWTSAGFEDDYQEGEYKKDGIEQLRAFHTALLENPPEILGQEKAFELPLENNVIINGRIDQINSLGRDRRRNCGLQDRKVTERSGCAERPAAERTRLRRKRFWSSIPCGWYFIICKTTRRR